MKYRTKSTLLWILAFFLMAASAIYQRSTGPTYPKKGKVTINQQEIKYKLLRTWEGETEAAIKIEVADNSITGNYKFKRFKSHDDWTEKPLVREGNNLVGSLPNLPPAGKMMYEVTLSDGQQQFKLRDESVVLRYKGAVPMFVLIPHIIFIFMAMMFSTRTGMEAIIKGKNLVSYSLWTVILFAFAGMFLGPVVQKYAFDAYWTGWPPQLPTPPSSFWHRPHRQQNPCCYGALGGCLFPGEEKSEQMGLGACCISTFIRGLSDSAQHVWLGDRLHKTIVGRRHKA